MTIPPLLKLVAGLLVLGCSAAQEVCFSGFVMDFYCINRGTLLDTGDETLRFPEKHSVHCLVDVSQCTSSGFAILQDPADGEDLYTPIVRLDRDGTDKVIELARQVGSCSTCDDGYNSEGQSRGFRATVRGTITDAGTSPPTMQVNEIAVGDQCDPNGTPVTSSPTVSPTALPISTADNPDCEVSLVTERRLTSSVTLREIIDLPEESVHVELVYEGIGWMGFGFSPDGFMVGTTAVIGLPDEPNSSSNPRKYFLGAQDVSFVQPVADESQTLRNATITQNATHTVLKFTKLLEEPNETDVSTTGPNNVIFAIGSDNTLAYHGFRQSLSLSLKVCDGEGATEFATSSSSQRLVQKSFFLLGMLSVIWISH